jgi:hypothetical protein
VTTVRLADVAVFLMVTAAAGIAELVLSVTRPDIEAVAACWPYNPVAASMPSERMAPTVKTGWFRNELMYSCSFPQTHSERKEHIECGP